MTFEELRAEAKALIADLERVLAEAEREYAQLDEVQERAERELDENRAALLFIERIQSGVSASEAYHRVRRARTELNRPKKTRLARRPLWDRDESAMTRRSFTGLNVEHERHAGLFNS
jgi:ElaB/YqjD/DUF883 family membrane-anchored ribosome-binding protein